MNSQPYLCVNHVCTDVFEPAHKVARPSREAGAMAMTDLQQRGCAHFLRLHHSFYEIGMALVAFWGALFLAC
jgi:hypothetical protein